MSRNDLLIAKGSPGAGSSPWARLTGVAAGSLLVSVSVVVSALNVHSALGAPLYWPWLLTGLQVLALWSAGTRRWWGWLLGAAVQPPWIAYALVTGQIGFIPGCAISAAVQAYSFLRADPTRLTGGGSPRLRQVEEYG